MFPILNFEPPMKPIFLINAPRQARWKEFKLSLQSFVLHNSIFYMSLVMCAFCKFRPPSEASRRFSKELLALRSRRNSLASTLLGSQDLQAIEQGRSKVKPPLH